MLFVGNQRGGGKDLALHLMKEENERVELHELRGFASDNLVGAFKESHAISRATKCKQHLYSLSINPPPDKKASNEDFENAINRAEERLGLTGQPRVIVFHEKEGRRHAHAVWCRIDTDEMKAVQLSHDHTKLMHLSRDIYIERGWQMPRGMIDKNQRDPRNFSLAEWQQSKRAGKDAREIKGIFKDAWAVSDSKAAFAHALEERGYFLAQGRRGHVAVDYQGEVYAISKWVGIRAKQVRERLGEHQDSQSLEQAHAQAAKQTTDRLAEIEREKAQEATRQQERLEKERHAAAVRQKAEKLRLAEQQAIRKTKEQAARDARIRKGIKGLLDRLTGQRKRALEQNSQEIQTAELRDHEEQAKVTAKQALRRKSLQQKHERIKDQFDAVRAELRTDTEYLNSAVEKSKEERKAEFMAKRQRTPTSQRKKRRSRRTSDPTMEM